MTQIAYLLLVHNAPRNALALVEDLAATGQDVFVHVDRKAGEYGGFLPEISRHAHILPHRRSVHWGGFTLLQTTIDLITYALSTSTARRLVLLSGACTPIRAHSELHAHLSAREHAEFIDITPIPELPRYKPGWVERYYANDLPLNTRAMSYMNRLARRIPRPSFVAAHGAPQFGSAWWALSRACLEWMEADRRRDPAFFRRFRMTNVPDEIYFSTLIMRSPFASQIVPGLTYADWSGRKAHPKLLGRPDLLAMERSERFFARKFDRAADPEFTAELSARWRG